MLRSTLLKSSEFYAEKHFKHAKLRSCMRAEKHTAEKQKLANCLNIFFVATSA
jgi:hypothetical protein